jgi:uncharacterized protein YdaU (DUF1376 family)
MFDFRKNKNEFPESILKELVAHAAYGIYWEIIEYLHENSLNIDEVDMLADELRIDSNILSRILNSYDLFKVVDGKFISERVLRNLKLQEEKSEKARQAVNVRHNRRRKEEAAPQPEVAPQENSPEYNEEFVMSIVQIYNDKFKKSQIVSKANKEKIFKIHTENKLDLDVWEKVFSNAKRGWDIGDKKNVPPSLKKILEEWDSFASDDYFLAPDREERKREEEERKAEEYRQAAIQRAKNEEDRKKREQEYEAISSKEDALEYLYKYLPAKSEFTIKASSNFKEFSKKYGITVSEAMNYFAAKGAKNA